MANRIAHSSWVFVFICLTCVAVFVSGSADVTAQLLPDAEHQREPLTPLTDSGLIAYYPFDGNANDTSGNGWHGTVSGASPVPDRYGNSSSAYGFNGSSFIAIPPQAINSLPDGTIVAWVNLDVAGRQHAILDKTTTGVTNDFQFIVDTNNKLRCYLDARYNDPPSGNQISQTPLMANQWYQVAVAWSGTQCSYFLDGRLDGAGTCPGRGGVPNSTRQPYVGKVDNNSALFGGAIDDLRIYNRRLSEAEIQALYTQSAPTTPRFVDIGANLIGTAIGSVSWGDYNKDGRPDLLVTGQTASGALSTKIYRNDGNNVFTDSGISLPGIYAGEAVWGDYDRDGYPDIALTGHTTTTGIGSPITRIYRNGGGNIFTDLQAALGAFEASSAGWGDYDRDGDLDLVVSGRPGGQYTPEKTYLFRNDRNSVFTNADAGLFGVMYGALAWGDYDDDDDPDLLLTGWTYYPSWAAHARLFRNDSGVFSQVSAPFTGVFESSVAWGDYDVDGDLDIVLAGCTSALCNSLARATIYRNDGNDTFVNVNAVLPNLGVAGIAWIDYDLDRKPDLLLTGCAVYSSPNCTTPITQMYHNDGSDTFTLATSNLMGVSRSAVAVVDYDNDGDPDIALNGKDASGTPVTKIYRNDAITAPTYSISGRVTDASGNGIAGVNISASASFSTTTDTSGNYTLNGLPAGVYTVTPSKNGYAFTPASRSITISSVNAAGQDFVGMPPLFEEIGISLPGVYYSAVAWGDYDDDDDPDILISGSAASGYVSRVYRNDGNGVFTDISAGLKEVYASSVAWGDYDRDGDLDILLTGLGPGGAPSQFTAKVYRNDAGHFTDINATLIGVYASSAEWGDYDGDGDLDIALQGDCYYCYTARIYRNNGNHTFTDLQVTLPRVASGSIAWDDYDGDGDLDLLTTGCTQDGGFTCVTRTTRIYRNEGGGRFTDTSAALTAVGPSRAYWGDYDRNGRSDLLLLGCTGTNWCYGTKVAKIYRNTGGNLVDINAALTPASSPFGGWIDYDRDGDLDALVAGCIGTESGSGGNPNTCTALATKLYRNDAGAFSDTNVQLPGLFLGAAAWGDYDKDGDPDLLLTGRDASGQAVTKLYRNNMAAVPLYAISGRVTDPSGNGIAGVSIADDKGHSTTTDAGGNYSIGGLAAGNYTVTPSKNGYAFAPPSRTVTVTTASMPGQDFVGSELATAVAAGAFHTCALTRTGEVKCWGSNTYGQLGNNTTASQSAVPVNVVGLWGEIATIAGYGYHTCALSYTGEVMCWGHNGYGQLGDGTNTDRRMAVSVTGLNPHTIAITAGTYHTCALNRDGKVQCWGHNSAGQLGDGTTTHRSSPVEVVGLNGKAIAIAAGGAHTCAILEGGQVKCWGYNAEGQIGDGTRENRSLPTPVNGVLSGATAIATGSSHTCALSTLGYVWCWGDNSSGQLGNNGTTGSTVPVLIRGAVQEITAGGSHTCAVSDTRGAWCWGGNNFGQLGDGSTSNRPAPTQVRGLEGGVAAVSAGGSAHTCALKIGGSVRCWGYNNSGQVGDGTTEDRSEPATVTGFDGSDPTPVILLPGVMGSRLSNDVPLTAECILRRAASGEIWLPDYPTLLLFGDALYLRDDQPLPVNPCDRIWPSGIMDSGSFDVYSTFINAIESAGYLVARFPYDWRLSLADSASKLDTFIKDPLPKGLGNPSKVVLVGHSMGGLLARAYIADRVHAEKVSQVISAGTPYWGAPKMAMHMRYGAEPGKSSPESESRFKGRSIIERAIRNGPGLMELLPSDSYFSYYPDGYYQDGSKLLRSYDATKDYFTSTQGPYGQLQNGRLLDAARSFHENVDDFSELHEVKYTVLVAAHQSTEGRYREYKCAASSGWCVEVTSYHSGDETVPWGSAALGGGTTAAHVVTFFKGDVTESHGDLMKDRTIIAAVKQALSGQQVTGSEMSAEKSAVLSNDLMQLSVEGQVPISVRDSLGRYMGIDEEGQLVTDIPGATYDLLPGQTIVALPATGTYSIAYPTQSGETIQVRLTRFSSQSSGMSWDQQQRAVFVDVALPPHATVSMPLDAAAAISSAQLMIDADGDGDVDDTIAPTNVLDTAGLADVQPPSTTISVEGQRDERGYYTGPVTVSLSAVDAGTGVLKTEFSLDAGQHWQTYESPLVFHAESVPVFLARSVDRAGNHEYPFARKALRPPSALLPLIFR